MPDIRKAVLSLRLRERELVMEREMPRLRERDLVMEREMPRLRERELVMEREMQRLREEMEKLKQNN